MDYIIEDERIYEEYESGKVICEIDFPRTAEGGNYYSYMD